MKQISIHDYKKKYLKKYYGSSRRVYRQHHVERILEMYRSLNALSELHTRTRLVPSNEEFLKTKAIPHYNNAVKRIQLLYPNILEIQRYKPIELK